MSTQTSFSQTVTATTWADFVAQHPHSSILQTPAWGEFKANFGWDWEIIAPEVCNGGALVLYKTLPFKLGTVAYIPRGPLMNWENSGQCQVLMQVLEHAARRRRAWALWLEPPLLDTADARATLHALDLRATMRTIQPPRTILVDIAADEDSILAQMKSKTRYNIRLAARKGVQVREGTLDDVATFYALMCETGSRDDFGTHSEAYYQQVLAQFLPLDQAALLLAEVEGEAVAGLVVFALGKTAWYFYGASSNRHRNRMPTYSLQWTAIQWAKARGCTVYDLWGIPDADLETLETQFTERYDGLWGVYRFKRGFGGEVVRYAGLWEKPLHPLYPLAARYWDARA